MPSTSSSVEVILLSGRSGSGKTTVSYEITEILQSQDIPHVNISADNLDEIWPKAQGSSLLLANLRSVWENYWKQRQGNIRKIVMSGTAIVTESKPIQSVIENVCRATHPDMEVLCHRVILESTDSIAAQRLGKRERGTALERHIQSSQKWARIFEEVEDAIKIDTSGKSVNEVATTILDQVVWLGG